MYKIYLNEHLLLFCTPGELPSGIVSYSPEIETTKLLQKLQTAKKLAVITGDPREEFDRFASGFTVIEAAGGIVANDCGEVLMIYRNGRWDLPKGKMEPGEGTAACALREIHEECGVDGLTIERPLTETYHIYRLDGKWVLKRTHWFAAMQKGPCRLTPQAEEGITEVKWVDKKELGKYLTNTYPTIRDVFGMTITPL